jgi:hypothetical protein
MERSTFESAAGRIMPKVRQAVAGSPMTMGRELGRHSAGESKASPLPEVRFLQSFQESSESGSTKLAALTDMRGKVTSYGLEGYWLPLFVIERRWSAMMIVVNGEEAKLRGMIQ